MTKYYEPSDVEIAQLIQELDDLELALFRARRVYDLIRTYNLTAPHPVYQRMMNAIVEVAGELKVHQRAILFSASDPERKKQ